MKYIIFKIENVQENFLSVPSSRHQFWSCDSWQTMLLTVRKWRFVSIAKQEKQSVSERVKDYFVDKESLLEDWLCAESGSDTRTVSCFSIPDILCIWCLFRVFFIGSQGSKLIIVVFIRVEVRGSKSRRKRYWSCSREGSGSSLTIPVVSNEIEDKDTMSKQYKLED